MKKIIILAGIPCSGKSSWVNHYLFNDGLDITRVVSRDTIRESPMFAKPYHYSKENEDLVTDVFNTELDAYLKAPNIRCVILDNTHCREKYIDEVIKKYSSAAYQVYIKFFDIPVWKALVRNVIRRIKTRNPYKWIPLKIMLDMKKNYDKINKKKYANLVHE